MATTRTRIKRAVKSRATDEARAIFTAALKLQSIYWGCVRGAACRSSSPVKHCPDCLKYLNLSSELGDVLGLKPWETSPLNIPSKTPYAWMRGNPQECERWNKAWGDALRAGGKGMIGRVVHFTDERGFGFIAPDGGGADVNARSQITRAMISFSAS